MQTFNILKTISIAESLLKCSVVKPIITQTFIRHRLIGQYLIGKPLIKKCLIVTFLVATFCGCSRSSGWASIPKHQAKAPSGSMNFQTSYDWNRPSMGAVVPGYLIKLDSPDPMVSGDFRIEFDNSLKLPYEIVVQTEGLSEQQMTENIRQAYRSYFHSPQVIKVSVSKKEYMLDVQGLVKKPGKYAFNKNASLDEIIAQAAGLTESNNKDQVARYVRIRAKTGETGLIRLADYHSGSKGLTPTWSGGEVLFFQTEGAALSESERLSNNLVTLLGQVKKPGEYAVEPNADFFTYLIKAEGPNDRADMGNVTLIRNQNQQNRALTFDMQEVATIPEIQAGDTLIFNADNPSSLEKESRLWANFANILSTIGVLVIAGKE